MKPESLFWKSAKMREFLAGVAASQWSSESLSGESARSRCSRPVDTSLNGVPGLNSRKARTMWNPSQGRSHLNRAPNLNSGKAAPRREVAPDMLRSQWNPESRFGGSRKDLDVIPADDRES